MQSRGGASGSSLLLPCRINIVVVSIAKGREARAVTSSIAEQFWKEGQRRVNPAGGKHAEVDLTFVSSSAEALKTVTRTLLLYRSSTRLFA